MCEKFLLLILKIQYVLFVDPYEANSCDECVPLVKGRKVREIMAGTSTNETT